jgi:hypothetical protein
MAMPAQLERMKKKSRRMRRRRRMGKSCVMMRQPCKRNFSGKSQREFCCSLLLGAYCVFRLFRIHRQPLC